MRFLRLIAKAFAAAFAFGIASVSLAGGGLLGIDHRVALDERGIWGRSSQQAALGLTITAVVATAFWEGGESRLGKTSWQSIDSTLITAATTTAGKFVFERARPSQTDDPNKWFQGKGHYSFPSGEVAAMSAAVTPYVIEYHQTHPWVWALELLPAYDSIARIKSQAHWQTDVLAGWAIGAVAGYYAHSLNSPWSLSIMPHSVQVGFRASW